MSNQTKQFVHTPSSKKSESALTPIEAMQEVQETLNNIERKGMENLIHTVDSLSETATENINICSDNIGALVESGNVAAQNLKIINEEIVKNYNQSIFKLVEFSREAFACRTIGDMTELQNRTAQQLSDRYFNVANKMCSMMFDACADAMMPKSYGTFMSKT